jgi:hypothetical protein
LFFIVVVIAAAAAATELNGGIARRGRRTSAGANNASTPPTIGAMPLLLLPGAILTSSLASLESGRRIARGEGLKPQMRRCGGLLIPPLGRNVDNDDNNDAAASGNPAAIGTWAKAEAVDAAPAIFSDAGARTCIFLGRIFVRESKCFMVEQILILFYPWCYYATPKYHDMRRGI